MKFPRSWMLATSILAVGIVQSAVAHESPSTMNEQIGSSALIPEETVQAEELTSARAELEMERGKRASPGTLGDWHAFYVKIGSGGGDKLFKVTGVNFQKTKPLVVLVQARQMSNLDHGWPDQFAVQVIETSRDFIRVRIRRIDDGTPPSGWGQNLRLDFFVIE